MKLYIQLNLFDIDIDYASQQESILHMKRCDSF